MSGHAILMEAAEVAAAAGQPDLAVAIFAEAANACFYAGDSTELTKTASRALDVLPRDPAPRTEFLATTINGMALVFSGDGEAGAQSIRRAIGIFESTPGFVGDVRLLAWAVVGTLWVRKADTGMSIVDDAVAVAREQVAIGTLPYLLHHVARYQATTDQWTQARANYHEAIRLSRETNQRTDLAAALAGLACLEARQGKSDCQVHAAEAQELCTELGAGIYDIWSRAALADLELGLGRPAAALDHLLGCEEALHTLGIEDADLSPAPELVEVYLRLGNGEAAHAAARAFDRRAKAKGQPWALARAARCRALLAPHDESPTHFAEALRQHARTPDTFETARTQLLFGTRLRRARQRTRSREALRTALELFDRLGATPWIAQASAELGATGETARRRDVSALDHLTPQELQIGLLLAGGRTIRQAAAALFLSPKTIEYHLGHVYRKLGVHSRGELAAVLADRGMTGNAPG
jgi:DNA-binding CsgD family transcriptional regulator